MAGKVTCNTTSGDVELLCPTAGDVEINTTSGDAELTDCYIQSLNVVSVSGDADLERTVAAGAVTISTTSGDIDLERSDAASLTLSTVSGEVEGSLLTAKNFAVSSTMGRISAPAADPPPGPAPSPPPAATSGWPCGRKPVDGPRLFGRGRPLRRLRRHPGLRCSAFAVRAVARLQKAGRCPCSARRTRLSFAVPHA